MEEELNDIVHYKPSPSITANDPRKSHHKSKSDSNYYTLTRSRPKDKRSIFCLLTNTVIIAY